MGCFENYNVNNIIEDSRNYANSVVNDTNSALLNFANALNSEAFQFKPVTFSAVDWGQFDNYTPFIVNLNESINSFRNEIELADSEVQSQSSLVTARDITPTVILEQLIAPSISYSQGPSPANKIEYPDTSSLCMVTCPTQGATFPVNQISTSGYTIHDTSEISGDFEPDEIPVIDVEGASEVYSYQVGDYNKSNIHANVNINLLDMPADISKRNVSISDRDVLIDEGQVVISDHKVSLDNPVIETKDASVVLSDPQIVLSSGEIVLIQPEAVLQDYEVVTRTVGITPLGKIEYAPVIVTDINLPSLKDIALSNLEDISVREFTDEAPQFNVDDPNIVEPTSDVLRSFSYDEGNYSSGLLSALNQWLLDSVENGRTGLAEAIEQALWNRAREREEYLVKKEKAEIEQKFVSRGFSQAPGSLLTRLQQAEQEAQTKISSLNRDISIKQAELAQQNTQFAVDKGIVLESRLMQMHSERYERILRAAVSTAELSYKLLDALFSMQRFKLEVYKVKADVYDARVRAFASIVEAYKAEVNAAIAKAELNKSRIEQDRLKLDFEKVKIDSERDTATLKLERDRVSIEQNKTQVEMGIESNRNIIEQDKLRIDEYANDVQAQRIAADVLNQKNFLEVDKARIDIEHNRLLVDKRRVEIDEDRLKIEDKQTTLDSDRTKVDAARLQLENNRVSIEKNRAQTEFDRNRIEAERIQLDKERLEIESQRDANDVRLKKRGLELDTLRAKIEAERLGLDSDRNQLEQRRIGIDRDRNNLDANRLLLEKDRVNLEVFRGDTDSFRAMDESLAKRHDIKIRNAQNINQRAQLHVDAARASAEQLRALTDSLRAQYEEYQLQLETDKLKLQKSQIELDKIRLDTQVYAEQVRNAASYYEAYRNYVEGDKVKADILRTQADIYTEELNAYATTEKLKLEAEQVKATVFQSEVSAAQTNVDAFRAQVQYFGENANLASSWINYDIKEIEKNVDVARMNVQRNEAIARTAEGAARLIIEDNKFNFQLKDTEYKLSFDKAKADADFANRYTEAVINAQTNITNSRSAMASAALHMVNTNASMSMNRAYSNSKNAAVSFDDAEGNLVKDFIDNCLV